MLSGRTSQTSEVGGPEIAVQLVDCSPECLDSCQEEQEDLMKKPQVNQA